MKKFSILSVLCGLVFLIPVNAQRKASNKKNSNQPSAAKKSPQQNTSQQKNFTSAEIRWTGTISLVEKSKSIIGASETHVDLSFTNALPTLYRNIETTDLSFTDDKGKGKIQYHAEASMKVVNEKTGLEEEKPLNVCDCSGEGKSELHEVVIDKSKGTYSISAVGPPCEGGEGSEGSKGACGTGASDIIISEKKLGSDPFSLSGTETIDRDITIGKVSFVYTWNLKGCLPWSDPQTRLKKVDARVKKAAEQFIKRAHEELCVKLKVASGLRTNHEQDSIYAIGRTSPPPPVETVTEAEAGSSYHNYGLAIDVYFVKDDGKLDFKTRIPPEVAKIGKEEGFQWGGEWKGKLRDYPHFEMRFGKSINQLKVLNGIH